MNRNVHGALLGIAAIVILIPGVRLLLDPSGYADGKDNLTITADLYSDLRATGSIFVASGLVLLAGAIATPLRLIATLVGIVAFLPQGITRIISYAADDGQHNSYIRAGIVETVIGVSLAYLLTQQYRNKTAQP